MGTLPYRDASGEVVVRADLSNQEYHSLPSLSSTGAKTFLDAPAKYVWERSQPHEPTRFMSMGTAIHSAVLEDSKDVVCVEATSWRTKAAKEEKEAIEATGKVALLAADYDKLQDLRDAVFAHPIAHDLLSAPDGVRERSYLWTDLETDVDMRARPDLYVPGRAVVDLKTTSMGADAHSFIKAIAQRRYFLQAAWYLNAVHLGELDDPDFVWIVVETNPPYLTAVYTLNLMGLDRGFELMDEALTEFRAAQLLDYWPGYDAGIQELVLPSWA